MHFEFPSHPGCHTGEWCGRVFATSSIVCEQLATLSNPIPSCRQLCGRRVCVYMCLCCDVWRGAGGRLIAMYHYL